MAVSSVRTMIRFPAAAASRSPSTNPSSTASMTSVEREPLADVQLGREADLGVDDAVGGEVLRALGRDPGERPAGLHDADGVREGLEVALEGAGVGRLDEPAAERLGVGRGQRVVAGLGGQLDDRGRAQPAVEVVVQQRLGRAPDRRPRAARRRGRPAGRGGADGWMGPVSTLTPATVAGTGRRVAPRGSTSRGVRPMRRCGADDSDDQTRTAPRSSDRLPCSTAASRPRC